MIHFFSFLFYSFLFFFSLSLGFVIHFIFTEPHFCAFCIHFFFTSISSSKWSTCQIEQCYRFYPVVYCWHFDFSFSSATRIYSQHHLTFLAATKIIIIIFCVRFRIFSFATSFSDFFGAIFFRCIFAHLSRCRQFSHRFLLP